MTCPGYRRAHTHAHTHTNTRTQHSTNSSLLTIVRPLLPPATIYPYPRLATEIQVPLSPGIRQRDSFPFRFVAWRCVGHEVLTKKREVPEDEGEGIGPVVSECVRVCDKLMWRGGVRGRTSSQVRESIVTTYTVPLGP